MSKFVTIQKIIDTFNLIIITGNQGLENKIYDADYHRPGLQLMGFFTKFPSEKIQIIGNQESLYLQSLNKEERNATIEQYVSKNPVCIIVTKNNETSYLTDSCSKHNIPLLKTTDGTHNFSEKLMNMLEKDLAKEMGIHGVCMNVYGVGILLTGDSGVGKSEAALSLVNKGHRLIADDLVILKKIGPSALIGTHNGINRHFLALRGIGLVNVPKVYGSGSIQEETRINLSIKLALWDDSKYYDAIQSEVHFVNYLNTNIKHIELPIRPGRDISELVEVAAKNWRLEQEGYNALEDFQSRLKF